MAKKRKAPSGRKEENNGPNLDVGSSRKRIKDFEDVVDSDDEFHLNRDEVLLEEAPDAKRRRRWQEQEEFLEPSDEEVLEYTDSEDEDVEDLAPDNVNDRHGAASEGSEDGEAEDDEEGIGWGMSKGEMYGADEIETEEQALEEEAEALRLQKKQLQSMTAADYGFDETQWQQNDTGHDGDEKDRNVVTEVLPQLLIGEDMGSAERLAMLRSRYPEFEPLSEELLHLNEVHSQLVAQTQPADSPLIQVHLPNAVTKLRAAASYVGALTMYFALLTSPAFSGKTDAVAMSASQLRDHPVMDTLVQCRDLWLRAQRLPTDPEPSRHESEISVIAHNGNMHPNASVVAHGVRTQPKPKSRAQKHAEATQLSAETRRADRMQRTEADLVELNGLITSSATRKSVKSSRMADRDGADSDLGEEAHMTAQEAAEKAKHKKSLRFYTSQIAQKANKRGTAGRNAGGDDDIPHRERLKDRQARLNAQAEKRGRRATDAGAELGGESDEEDARQAQEVRDGGEDDYYDLVAARTAKKKMDKAAFAEAQKQAALQGGMVYQAETVGPDGKRKITYAIEKNKGLTPHRKKEVRNPRVKKRKKYDEKKKKLSSVKAVYKGGEGRGGYGGELTGIKMGLVKSTKL